LRPAIAAKTVEHVARKALGMNANQDRLGRRDVTHSKHYGFLFLGSSRSKAEDAEISVFSGESGLGDFFDHLTWGLNLIISRCRMMTGVT
jgi:hypothetical protein